MPSKAEQPALGHFSLRPLLIVVCGSDFRLPISLRVIRMAGISGPFLSASGSLYSTIQMFFTIDILQKPKTNKYTALSLHPSWD